MRKLALSLIIVLMLPQVLAAKSSDKYQELFYPKGMPVYGGKSPTYEFHGEYDVPGANCIVVLYTENYDYERDEFSEEMGHEVVDFDISHGVFVGVLEKRGKKLVVRKKMDITKKVLDEECMELGGSVEGINVFKTGNFFMLGIQIMLAGKGRITFYSDFIFELDKDKSPRIVLKLERVASFGQSRWDDYRRKSTTIYAAEVDGVPEIFTRSEEIEVDEENQIDRDMIEDGYSVYKYNKTEHIFNKSNRIHTLPEGAKELVEEKI